MSDLVPTCVGASLEPLKKSSGLVVFDPVETWLKNFTSAQTKTGYERAIRGFISFSGVGSLEALATIDRGAVIQWRDAMMDPADPARPRTVCARLSALSSLFEFLCNEQIAERNPVKGVKRPKVEREKVSAMALSREQVRKLLDAPNIESIGGLRDRAILHVFFYTGCRLTEPTSLRVRNYGWDQGFRVIDFTVKGGKSNRVAIHPECIASLDAYLAAAGHGADPDAWLFQQVKHWTPGPLSRRTLSQVFEKYRTKADLPKALSPHSARATFITEALEREHPAEAVQKTVGHADISTTLSYDKRDHHPRRSASFAVRY